MDGREEEEDHGQVGNKGGEKISPGEADTKSDP